MTKRGVHIFIYQTITQQYACTLYNMYIYIHICAYIYVFMCYVYICVYVYIYIYKDSCRHGLMRMPLLNTVHVL